MIRCKSCMKKVDDSTIQNGVCPECFEKEVKMEKKSIAKAVLMSILPGAGHKFYLDQDKKGTAILLLFLIGVIIWPLLVLSWLYAFVDSWAEVKRINNGK